MAEEYFGKSLDTIKRAIAAHELQGYEDLGPYIFTKVSKRKVGDSSSAFGPGQITGKTIEDLMARYPKQFTGEFKNYALSMISQGKNKLNIDYYKSLYADGEPVKTTKTDRKIFGPLGKGNISKEMHDKNYDKLWTLTIKDKAKAAKNLDELLQNYHGDAKNQKNNIIYSSKVQEKFDLLEKLPPLGMRIPDARKTIKSPFTTDKDITLPESKPERNLEQTLDQEGPIADTGEDIPVPEDMKPRLEDRVIEVPEEKSMYERVKPYIPVLRHLNEGGAIPMKRQMEMFDEGGLSTDEDFKEDLEGTFEITPEMQERMDEMTKEERDALRRKLVADAMERMLSKSPEKMDRSKFIQQYNEGGLEQDGGTKDPVSGNDVPPGSSQEEVRDDIPAQLSEGEFVFPADVVRYIGLEKLMQMRQEAKMGLKMMDEMGQMGNSEEATMPDDLPFDINDLDMDDEIDDNTQNFNVGGMPMPNQQAGVFFTPGTSGIATSPVQAASAQYQPDTAEPARPQQAPVPIYQPKEIPEYTPFIGGGAPNVEQETRQFINDEGNIINVIYNKATGEPLNEAEKAKITEGYRPYDPNAPKVEDTTVTPTQVQTTTVTGEGGNDEARQRREEEMYGPGGGRVGVDGKIYGVSFDMPEGFMPGMGASISTALSLATGEPLPEGVTVNFKRDDVEFSMTSEEYNDFKSTARKFGYNSKEASQKLNELGREEAEKEAKLAQQIEKARKVEDNMARAAQKIEDKKERDAALLEVAKRREERSIYGTGGDDTGTKGQGYSVGSKTDKGSGATDRGFGGTGRGRSDAPGMAAADVRSGSSYGTSPPEGPMGSISGRPRAKGGLMEAPKPKAKKKMKRGGLASKK
jgi:hypothetical protein